jgi:hypothetical protein
MATFDQGFVLNPLVQKFAMTCAVMFLLYMLCPRSYVSPTTHPPTIFAKLPVAILTRLNADITRELTIRIGTQLQGA